MQFACSDVPNLKTLDYVCAWYIKAAKFAENTKIKIAFVSTNSITQGEQAGILWQYLLDKGAKIHFAHRTFKWSNEAKGNAAVFCVVVGFALFDSKQKRLFDYETPKSESHEIEAKNINPYLIDALDTVIANRTTPINNVPTIRFGNQPIDGGNFILSDEERQEIISKKPLANKFIREFIGSQEFINGKTRWCLWLKDALPTEIRNFPEILHRVEAVKDFRLKSKRADTRKLALTPYLFAFISHQESNYIIIPSVSSERRKYVPIGFMPKDVIASNLCLIVPNATPYHFGVLTSIMHNAWMRQVCGRLKSDYRYSNNLVYNNFPFPKEATEKQIERVTRTAQSILDVRLNFPGATLADLYDPLTMPKELLDAHRANDEAVDACYGKQRFKNELERLEFLFDLYRKYTEPLAMIEEKETRKAKRKQNRTNTFRKSDVQ